MLRQGGSPGRAAPSRSAASTLPSARSSSGVVIPASRKRAATSAPMFGKPSRESVPGSDAIDLTSRESIPAPHPVGRPPKPVRVGADKVRQPIPESHFPTTLSTLPGGELRVDAQAGGDSCESAGHVGWFAESPLGALRVGVDQ